jgi:nucleotide-binding universal stress UspA family protein
LLEKAKANSTADVSISQIHGEVVENLLELKDDVAMLVLGLSDTAEHTIGENIKEIIREVHKPVLLVNSEFTQPKKIMIAYNGSHESKQILKIVANDPFFGDVERTIVTVDKNPIRGEKLLEEAQNIFDDKNITVETKLLKTNPKQAIVSEFENGAYDILVMGAFSNSRMKEFIFGSFTSYILENIKKPILLFR